MTNTFKVAIIISIAVHAFILAPYAMYIKHEDREKLPEINLNYLLIQKPELAIEKELKEESVKEAEHHSSLSPSETVFKEPQLVAFHKVKSRAKELKTEASEESLKVLAIDQTALLEYYNLIRERIRFQMHKGSLKEGRGEVTIIFTVSPKGELLRIDNIKTSIPSLSTKIFQSIKRVAPFPAFPKQFGLEPITFSLTVNIS